MHITSRRNGNVDGALLSYSNRVRTGLRPIQHQLHTSLHLQTYQTALLLLSLNTVSHHSKEPWAWRPET
jgi:hypothetical protein